jgi:multiple sugar transport system substrate-binding protein
VLNDESPDIAQGHVYAMAGQNLAEPLDEPWAAWEEENPEAATQFLPTAMQEVTWQDTRYGIPLDIYTTVLLYNRSHFDQAGIPYPQADYDLFSLQQAAARLTDPNQNRYGLGVTTDPWYASAWVASAGGNLVNEMAVDKYSPTLNAPINIETLGFLTDMVEAGYAPLPSSRPRDYEDARHLFLTGQISMYFGEPQDIHLIQSTMPDFPLGVAQLPQTPAKERSASVLGSSGLFIPTGARHPEVAFEFMKWMASDDYIIPMARRQGRFPAKVWLLTSPDFTKNLSLIPFFNQLQTAQPYRLDLFPRSEEAFSDAIKKAFYDLATPTQALREAQQTGLRPPLEPLR